MVFWIAVGTIVIMAGWSFAAATYLAFRDDVLSLIARQAEQQFAYEDRIAELRAQIDRTTSRQLLDQEQFEQKLDALIRRQATLEQRATALGGGIDPATTGSIRGTSRQTRRTGKPSPINDALAAPRRPDHGASLEPFRTEPANRQAEEGSGVDVKAHTSRLRSIASRSARRRR